MVDVSQYKVGVILSFEGCGTQKSKCGKALKACQVNIGEDEPVVVVTSASNVRVGSRVVVAPLGSTIVDDEGAEVKIIKTSVGGVMSEGIFCDSRMLGWSGGGVGVAAQVPPSFEIGSPPPATKPRPEDEAADPSATTSPGGAGLFEKKLSKEERKKLAAEKRLAKKAAKDTTKSNEEEEGEDDEALQENVEQ